MVGIVVYLLYTLFELTNQIARLEVANYLLINPPVLLINSPGYLLTHDLLRINNEYSMKDE